MADFDNDLVIDQYALDQEWIKQPTLYSKWATNAVNASFEYDKAKENLDIVRANLEKNIRQNPSAFDIEKLTEGAVQAAIAGNILFQEANSKLIEAKKNSRILDIGKDAFEHKKKALEKLTDLYLAKYYSEPYIPPPFKSVVEGQAKEGVQKALQQSMGERKLLRRRES